jgi:predicted nucleotidyltransferase
MSVVTYAHRKGSLQTEAADYVNTVAHLTAQFEKIPWVESVIICGSYAKGSLAPGWSDLDVVVVHEGGLTQDRVAALKLTGTGRTNPLVPVGLDVVSKPALLRTRRVVGRPLAMTFELKRYAMAVHGENPFTDIPTLPNDTKQIQMESTLLVRSDANSYLRRLLNGYANETEQLFDAVKTMLRIAMFESSGLPYFGITVPDYCAAIRSETDNPLVVTALTAAETLRETWKTAQSAPEEYQAEYDTISKALMHYSEAWDPLWN